MKQLFFLILSVLIFPCANAQMINIVIDSMGSPNEPCIAIDPRNPNHMVAGANTDFVYESLDAGYTWTKNTLTSTYGVFGDPVVIADTTGAFYYTHLALNASITTWPDWADRIVCQRLDVAGGAWTNGTFTGHLAPAMQDKQWMAVDRNTNMLYVTWTQFDKYGSTLSSDSSNILFSRSADRGNTWSPAIRINKKGGDCVDGDFTVEGAVPCVGPNGEVFVAWNADDKILFDRSYDNGNTWLANDRTVAVVPGGWDYDVPGLSRCNGLSFIACDLSSGTHRGTLYVNWSDQSHGISNTDVWISKSTDSGQTWSAPILVNDDFSGTHQFMSSMTVDPSTGYIYVLFYDRRNYVGSDHTDVYLAVSKDGAATFQNHLISTSAFLPDPGTFFGDYTYICAADGVVRPIWARLNVTDIYKQKIMTAIIDSTITSPPLASTEKNATTPAFDLRVFPNPVTDNATIVYNLPGAGNTSLYLTDITGRKVAVPEHNTAMQAGRGITRINMANYGLAPGLYFLCLENSGSVETIKLVYRQ